MTIPTPEERQFWEDNGYLVLEQAMVGKDLLRLQEAFHRAAADCKEEWLQGIARGTRPAAHFDIPNPFERRFGMPVLQHVAHRVLTQ